MNGQLPVEEDIRFSSAQRALLSQDTVELTGMEREYCLASTFRGGMLLRPAVVRFAEDGLVNRTPIGIRKNSLLKRALLAVERRCRGVLIEKIDFSQHLIATYEDSSELDFEVRYKGQMKYPELYRLLLRNAERRYGETVLGASRNNPFVRFKDSEAFYEVKRELYSVLAKLDRTPPQTSEASLLGERTATLFHFFAHETGRPDLLYYSDFPSVRNARIKVKSPKVYYLTEYQVEKLFTLLLRVLPESEGLLSYLRNFSTDREVLDAYLAIMNVGSDGQVPHGMFDHSREAVLQLVEMTGGNAFIRGRQEIRVFHCFAMAVCIALHYLRNGNAINSSEATAFCPQRVCYNEGH
ncbi:MAG: hypothetical protein KDD70_09650 [Bdellovibrionales bacterium]|nr:hypothetical protein [Bdellovibrionales bacterium]